MSNILVEGKISIFTARGEPLFTLKKSATGLWHFEGYNKDDTSTEISNKSAITLQKFMTYHTERKES